MEYPKPSFSAFKLTVSFTFIFLYTVLPARGFYEYEGEQNSVELRGFIRFFGALNINPDNSNFYKNDSDLNAGGVGRLVMDAQLGNQTAIEFNGYQFINSTTASSPMLQSQEMFNVDVDRSSAFEWNQHDDQETKATLAIDRLNIRLSHSNVDLTLGRQPINLATQFYFTPNDFFAPFAAQTFYRVYKSGVDAARVEVQIGELSQFSLIGVLGYDPDSSSSNGWSADPSWKRSSLLARISAPALNFEWALLGGVVKDKDIIGVSLQGDLFEWLGLRAEGHYAMPDDNSMNNYTELSVGLEYRFPNDLDLRGEFFHHGIGADSINYYSSVSFSGSSTLPYLARQYIAVGVGYQLSPLLLISGVSITNLIDQSHLLSFNGLYSLSDESELSFGLIVPIGQQTNTNSNRLESEFGLYPCSANIEFRMYF